MRKLFKNCIDLDNMHGQSVPSKFYVVHESSRKSLLKPDIVIEQVKLLPENNTSNSHIHIFI